MKAYISIGRSSRNILNREVGIIETVLAALDITSLIFVDKHSFTADQEKEMMQQAMDDIDSCDLLIAEVSEKAIGVGVEAGYARGKGKTIIYLRKQDADHSTTISGISDYQLAYKNTVDLRTGLEKIIKLWIAQRGGLSERMTHEKMDDYRPLNTNPGASGI